MATTVLSKQQVPVLRQNWVLSPSMDIVFVIAAPVMALIWAAATMTSLGAAAVFAIFGVLNVAHHFPTFIRIYGDKELLRRFQWRLLLGPIIPFASYMAVAACFIQAGLPISSIAFLSMILVIWDPWHFVMQHYGFVRIYDRNNRAPRRLASRMDLLICWSWFIYIMVAAIDWFPDIIYSFYHNHHLALADLFDSGVYPIINQLALVAAVATTVVYAGYLIWCERRGYYVSYAKLLLIVTTFAVMCLTYIPNSLMTWLVPDWNFQLGFATLGMVHVTQYLAIVWKYNRGMAKRPGIARPGIFVSAFGRGGLLIAFAYAASCLCYGFLLFEGGVRTALTSALENSSSVTWIVSVLMAAGFTSTIMHYYYDGFIWKVRHQENRQNLGIDGISHEKAANQSWWNDSPQESVPLVLWRQSLYFGLPIVVLAGSYGMVIGYSTTRPDEQLRVAYDLQNNGLVEQSRKQAELAISAMDERVKVEQQLIQIRPRPIHFATIAELLHHRARAERDLLTGGEGQANMAAYEHDMQAAIRSLEQALDVPAYAGQRPRPDEIRQRLGSFRRELGGHDVRRAQSATEANIVIEIDDTNQL